MLKFALIWVGKKIDEFKLFNYALGAIVMLSISSFLFSKIVFTFLIISIFLMRFSGQGLMSHTATTAISRYFERSERESPKHNLVWSVLCRIYFASFSRLF